MTLSVEFFVPGKPAPQGSKRHVGRGVLVESSKDVGPWRERIALAAHNAMLGDSLTLSEKEPVAVDLMFVMPRPASAPKRSTPPAIKRPDIDKLARAVLDALTNTVFSDDSAVTDLVVRKRVAELLETPGVQINIRTQHNA